MCTAKNVLEKLLGVIFLLLIIPTPLFGEDTDEESKAVRQGSPQEEPKSKPNFVLTIKDNLVSLDAKDASLVEIVEEIGSRMKTDVITKIPEEKKINTKFDKLPLKAAIESLREFADIAYIRDWEGKKGKITKILVFPKGKGEELSKPTINEEEEEEELIGPEAVVGEEAVGGEALQTEAEEEEAVEEETHRPEPFKFEFDPSDFEEE